MNTRVNPTRETGAQRTEWPGLGLSDSEGSTAPPVMLAVPRVPQAQRATAKSHTVPLIEPDANPLQNLVQKGRQRFVSVIGGSRLWRLFVGGGFAVLVGAVTLIVLEPRSNSVTPFPADPASSDSPEPPPAGSDIAEDATADRSNVELVVSETEGMAGQQQAEYMDPFIAENLVTGGVQHAVHHTGQVSDEADSTIRQVATESHSAPGPAWLSGSIEADEADRGQSRPQLRSRR